VNKREPFLFGSAFLLVLLLVSFWLDDPIRRFVEQHTALHVYRVMAWITRLGEGFWLLIIGLILWLIGGLLKRPRWAQAGRFSCYGVLGSFVVQILKHFFGRPRPRFSDMGIVHLGPSFVKGYDSFPSGHAVSAFAVAVVLARFYPRGRGLFYGIAALVGISRVYLNVHYTSDVVGGALLGVAIGLGLFRIEPAISGVETKVSSPFKKRFTWTSTGAILGITIVSAVLFFYQLGSFTLTDVDEGVYAAIVQEMIATGDWISPHYNGAHHYDKPILLYWLMATAYFIFGANEFAARFWSALLGVGLVLMTFLFAKRYGGIKLGLISALILATSLETVGLAHAALTDMPLVFFMTGALYAFILALDAPDPIQSRSWYLTSGSAMALAVLTKGPVGIAIPVLIIGPFLIAVRKWKSVLTPKRLLGVGAVFFLIAAPWYLMQLFVNGWEFVDEFILKHNIGRYTGVVSSHSGSWFYYFIVLLIGFFPWVSFLPSAILAQVSKRLAVQSSSERLGLFLLIWFAVVFLFFTFAQTKLPNYVAPLFPPAAILVAQWLIRNFSDQWDLDRSAWFSIGLLILITMGLAITFLAVPTLIEKAQQRFGGVPYLSGTIDIGQGPRLLALELLIGAMLGLWLMIRRPFASILFLAGMMVVFHLTLIQEVLPVVDRYVQRPLKDFALRATHELKGGELVVYGMNKPSVLFYANRYAWIVFHPDAASDLRLQAMLDSKERHFVITKANLMPRFETMSHFFIVEQRGGYLLASNQPAP
jgi:4-amino-4-deoxy-L-arabinose transferase-like glycosyltransferase/membrane-associated phospholipid phosphatase